jgi:hypothetical protein
LSFTVPTPLPTVVAGESQQVNVSISMLTTAPDACQGVTVGVTYSVNGEVG